MLNFHKIFIAQLIYLRPNFVMMMNLPKFVRIANNNLIFDVDYKPNLG